MQRHIVWTVAVAVASTLSLAQPAAAQYGPPPAYRPPPTQPYPTYPSPYGYGYNDPVFERGFADGYEEGVEDARDRDRYDPRRHRRYRSGDHGYRGWYGPREYYRNAYRRGFLDGYERGYGDAALYRRRGWRGGGWIGFGWRF